MLSWDFVLGMGAGMGLLFLLLLSSVYMFLVRGKTTRASIRHVGEGAAATLTTASFHRVDATVEAICQAIPYALPQQPGRRREGEEKEEEEKKEEQQQGESCHWLAAFVAQVLAKCRASEDFHNAMLARLDRAMNQRPSLPPYLAPVRIQAISWGSAFLRFGTAAVRVIPLRRDKEATAAAKNPGQQLAAEFGLTYEDRIVVSLSTALRLNMKNVDIATLPIDVTLTIVRFSGTLRVEIGDMSPDGTFLALSILDKFDLDFDVETSIGSHTRVNNIPHITTLLTNRIKNFVIDHFVYPNFHKIAMRLKPDDAPVPPPPETAPPTGSTAAAVAPEVQQTLQPVQNAPSNSIDTAAGAVAATPRTAPGASRASPTKGRGLSKLQTSWLGTQGPSRSSSASGDASALSSSSSSSAGAAGAAGTPEHPKNVNAIHRIGTSHFVLRSAGGTMYPAKIKPAESPIAHHLGRGSIRPPMLASKSSSSGLGEVATFANAPPIALDRSSVAVAAAASSASATSVAVTATATLSSSIASELQAASSQVSTPSSASSPVSFSSDVSRNASFFVDEQAAAADGRAFQLEQRGFDSAFHRETIQQLRHRFPPKAKVRASKSSKSGKKKHPGTVTDVDEDSEVGWSPFLSSSSSSDEGELEDGVETTSRSSFSDNDDHDHDAMKTPTAPNHHPNPNPGSNSKAKT